MGIEGRTAEARRRERQRRDAEAAKVNKQKGATMAAYKLGVAKMIVAERIGESRENRQRTRERVAKRVASKPELRSRSERDLSRVLEWVLRKLDMIASKDTGRI